MLQFLNTVFHAPVKVAICPQKFSVCLQEFGFRSRGFCLCPYKFGFCLQNFDLSPQNFASYPQKLVYALRRWWFWTKIQPERSKSKIVGQIILSI